MSYLSAVSGLPPSSPPCEPVTTIAFLCSGKTSGGGVECPDLGRFSDEQECRFQRFRRRVMRRARLLQRGGGVAARLAGGDAERCGLSVRMSDDAVRHHVGAVADPRCGS